VNQPLLTASLSTATWLSSPATWLLFSSSSAYSSGNDNITIIYCLSASPTALTAIKPCRVKPEVRKPLFDTDLSSKQISFDKCLILYTSGSVLDLPCSLLQ